MKIKFLEAPKGRPEYKAGEIYEFKGPVEETYGRKFLDRGWAEPVDEAALRAQERTRLKAESDEKARLEAEAKAKAAASQQT